MKIFSKLLDWITYQSYQIIQWVFIVDFISLCILGIVLEKVPMVYFYIFLFIAGLFVGYSFAYYSIKCMQRKCKD